MKEKTNKQSMTVYLTVSAMMIALSTVLSELIPSIELPFGGSITVFSMVPMCLLGVLFGTRLGLFAGLGYSIVQLIFGIENLQWATSGLAVATIILFDYIVAYGVLGLSGIFKKVIKNELLACVLGVVFVCFLRYVCHFITGVTVWREISEFWAAVWFSVTYNGSYMIPEIIITPIGVALLIKSGILKRLRKY